MLPDEQLVASAQKGDRQALEELLSRHYERIFSLCRRILNSEEDALDATQEAFLAIVKSLPKFEARSAFSTWAYSIAVNACRDAQRRDGRQPRPTEEIEIYARAAGGAVWEAGVGGASVGEVRSGGKSARTPEDVAVAKVDVQACLEQLPEEFKVAVVLRDQAELSYEEMAEVLEVPVGTVRSRIARGRAQLVELLSGSETGGN